MKVINEAGPTKELNKLADRLRREFPGSTISINRINNQVEVDGKALYQIDVVGSSEKPRYKFVRINDLSSIDPEDKIYKKVSTTGNERDYAPSIVAQVVEENLDMKVESIEKADEILAQIKEAIGDYKESDATPAYKKGYADGKDDLKDGNPLTDEREIYRQGIRNHFSKDQFSEYKIFDYIKGYQDAVRESGKSESVLAEKSGLTPDELRERVISRLSDTKETVDVALDSFTDGNVNKAITEMDTALDSLYAAQSFAKEVTGDYESLMESSEWGTSAYWKEYIIDCKKDIKMVYRCDSIDELKQQKYLGNPRMPNIISDIIKENPSIDLDDLVEKIVDSINSKIAFCKDKYDKAVRREEAAGPTYDKVLNAVKNSDFEIISTTKNEILVKECGRDCQHKLASLVIKAVDGKTDTGLGGSWTSHSVWTKDGVSMRVGFISGGKFGIFFENINESLLTKRVTEARPTYSDEMDLLLTGELKFHIRIGFDDQGTGLKGVPDDRATQIVKDGLDERFKVMQEEVAKMSGAVQIERVQDDVALLKAVHLKSDTLLEILNFLGYQSRKTWESVKSPKMEGNNVSDLPPAIDGFLQDIAQIYGGIDYGDILDFSHVATKEDIESLRKLRRKINRVFDDGAEDDDPEIKSLVNQVATLVKSKKKVESFRTKRSK